jgi:hypothetical protein
VPSSPAGDVSIYLGLLGPTLVVADLAATGECAVTQAWELVASGEVDRVAAVAVEEKSVIVDAVFRVLFGPGDANDAGRRPQRREGAGAVALAAADVARAQGLPVLARVVQLVAWAEDEAPLAELMAPPASARAVVVLGADEQRALLERSGWGAVSRLSCAEQSGSHEAAGGIAVAVAAARLASDPSLDAALVLGAARGWGYAILLGRDGA